MSLTRVLIHTSNGVIKGLLGKVASLIRGVEDLIVEHREVERESEARGGTRGRVC